MELTITIYKLSYLYLYFYPTSNTSSNKCDGCNSHFIPSSPRTERVYHHPTAISIITRESEVKCNINKMLSDYLITESADAFQVMADHNHNRLRISSDVSLKSSEDEVLRLDVE